VLDLFLRRSGYQFSIIDPPALHDALEDMIVAVVEHRMDFDQLVAWFKTQIVRAA
jgi:prophage maintenance system killer protein